MLDKVTPFPLRRIRSFVRRDSRITDAQKRAWTQLWPQMGLDLKQGLIDYTQVFHREAPRIVEIGFGSGFSLIEAAKLNPTHDFIGIEMHQPGIGALLASIEANQLTNIRVFYADAVEVFTQCIPDHSLAMIQIFFPDPWPKRKHHKRRLIQTEFINLILPKLQSGGSLHLATDWEHYGQHMMAVLSAIPELENQAGIGAYANRSSQRPIITKFERRGTTSGRLIWELQFRVVHQICRSVRPEEVAQRPSRRVN